MPSTIQSLGIHHLSRDERIELALEIWESVAAESSMSSLLSDPQQSELRRRVAEDDSNPNDVIPWEQLKAETLARLKP